MASTKNVPGGLLEKRNIPLLSAVKYSSTESELKDVTSKIVVSLINIR